MNSQPFLNENESNEEAEKNPDQQQNSPNPLLINQNNNEHISQNSNDKESIQPQLAVNNDQIHGLILQPRIDFSKYTNINQLNHRHINQIDNNTFNIKKDCCDKIYIILPLFACSLGTISALTLGILIISTFLIIIGIIFFLLTFFLFFYMLRNSIDSINFILGPNDITVEQIGCCKKIITKYEPGQLINIKLISHFNYNCGNNYISYISFKAYIDGIPLEINYFTETKSSQIYTPEEIGYFNYVINHHIQTKMRILNYYISY